MRRWGRSIAVVILCGVVTAIILFGVTSATPTYAYLGPLCAIREIAPPGFDPWTGVPHGRIFDCKPIDGSATTRVTGEPPDELIGRPVVPLPLGFALGAFITLVWLTARSITEADRRRGRNPEATSG
jgi:hypothetical protein